MRLIFKSKNHPCSYTHLQAPQDNAKTKLAKEYYCPAAQTEQPADRQTTKERRAACNKGLAKVSFQCLV